MSTNQKYIIFAGVAICIGFIFFIYIFSPDSETAVEPQHPIGETHKVVLKETGYDPHELTISKGDVVEFSSERNFPHWPASNLHPAHNIYPAFDPKGPIGEGETWSFQFTRVGTWEFHDHLNSTFGGVITVTDTADVTEI